MIVITPPPSSEVLYPVSWGKAWLVWVEEGLEPTVVAFVTIVTVVVSLDEGTAVVFVAFVVVVVSMENEIRDLLDFKIKQNCLHVWC